MAKHPRRTTSPKATRRFRFKLRPGQRHRDASYDSDCASVLTSANGGFGVEVSLTCECTKGEPNKPDCKPKSTTSPGGDTITVKCQKSGGCQSCKQSVTTATTGGVIMA
jgi:hypothetical protein